MTNSLLWLGHSSWQLTTSKGAVFYIDPWLNGNPVAPMKIADLPAAAAVLITHDHMDHAADASAVVKQTGATLVAQPETAARYKTEGGKQVSMNVGGTVTIAGVEITMVDATHTSETGTPAAYILKLEDGKTLYHAGDTGLTANMGVWGDYFQIDVALLPIGGHYTMDGRQAARALTLLKPAIAIPMHYKTFPFLAQSAEDFIAAAGKDGFKGRIVTPEVGGTFTF